MKKLLKATLFLFVLSLFILSAAAAHSYGEWKDAQKADGVVIAKTRKCTHCGETLSWTLTEEGYFYASGKGSMFDFEIFDNSEGYDNYLLPWDEVKEQFTRITIGEGLTEIPHAMFKDCVNVTYVSLPSSIKHIASDAFAYCTSLKNVTIPENTKTVYFDAFYGCTSLESVTISGGNTVVYGDAFDGCPLLKTIYYGGTLSNYINYIEALGVKGADLFIGGEKITEVVIPDEITEITENGFKGINITKLTFNKNLKRVESYVFSEMPKLCEIVVNSHDIWIHFFAFSGCQKDKLKFYCYIDSSTHEFAIEEGYAYEFIDDGRALTGKCGENLTYVHDRFDGILTISGIGEMNSYSYPAVPPWNDDKVYIREIVIEEGVTGIGHYAFSECKELEKVTWTTDITKIGAAAFLNCTKAVFPSLHEGIESIFGQAFKGCSKLSGDIVLPSTITTLGTAVFSGCSSIETADFSAVNIDKLSENMFVGCGKLKEVKLPDTIKTISSSAFMSCGALSSIKLPHGLERIGAQAFYMSGLTSVELPNGIVFIGTRAFFECKKLLSFKIHSKVAEFYEPDYLTVFSNPASVTFYCYEGSTADTFAKEKGATVEYMREGDVNGDGAVTMIDAMLSIVADSDEKDGYFSDMNGDGEINLLDVLKIFKAAVQ